MTTSRQDKPISTAPSSEEIPEHPTEEWITARANELRRNGEEVTVRDRNGKILYWEEEDHPL